MWFFLSAPLWLSLYISLCHSSLTSTISSTLTVVPSFTLPSPLSLYSLFRSFFSLPPYPPPSQNGRWHLSFNLPNSSLVLERASLEAQSWYWTSFGNCRTHLSGQAYLPSPFAPGLRQNRCLVISNPTMIRNSFCYPAHGISRGIYSFSRNGLLILDLKKFELSRAQLWVQLHGLPLSIASLANIKLIRDHMGILLEIEPIPFCFACKKFVHIRVELDVSLPLKTGFLFPCDNKSLAHISFKYEKLSYFCFHCGCLGHAVIFCSILNTHFEFTYGSDLRADPRDARTYFRSISALQYSSSSSFSASQSHSSFHPNPSACNSHIFSHPATSLDRTFRNFYSPSSPFETL